VKWSALAFVVAAVGCSDTKRAEPTPTPQPPAPIIDLPKAGPSDAGIAELVVDAASVVARSDAGAVGRTEREADEVRARDLKAMEQALEGVGRKEPQVLVPGRNVDVPPTTPGISGPQQAGVGTRK
jgi:hypothetical protein